LAGYASGFWFIDAVGGWRSMYGVAAPLALLLGVGMVRQAGFVCAPPRGGGGGEPRRALAHAQYMCLCVRVKWRKGARGS
jgi:hypothetical protein